jgi:hypothetical protein
MPGNSFWQLHGPEGGLAGVLYRAKQLAAGAIESTVANTATPQDRRSGIALGGLGYRPAIVDQPGALLGIIQTLTGHTPKPGSYTAEALRRAQLGSVRTNRTLGINDPRNTAETALRVGGNFLIPGPKAGVVAKAAADAPYLVKGVRALARGASELALPLNQTGIKGTALGTAIGTGLTEAVHKAVPNAQPGYKGIGDGTTDAERELDSAFAPTPAEEETRLVSQDVSPDESAFDSEVHAELDKHEERNKLAGWQQSAVELGALVTSVGAVHALRAMGVKSLQAPSFEILDRITGKKFVKSNLSGVDSEVTKILDAHKPIRNVVEQVMSPPNAARYGHKLDTINNTAIGSKLRDQFVTGRIVGSTGRTVKLAPVAEAYAKELTPEEQIQVSDALIKASALDDFKRTGTLSSANLDREGNPLTPVDLDNAVTAVKNNPKLNKYFEAIQTSYKDKLKFEYNRGLISREQYTKMLQDRPNYVELNRNLEADVKAMSQERHQSTANDALGATRSTDEFGGVQGTTGVANPFHTLFGSWSEVVQRAEQNDLRAGILRDVAANSPLDANGNPIVKQLPLGQQPYKKETVHQVFVNGQVINYRVSDPALNKALLFSPRASVQALETMRHMYQNLTTGPVATLVNGFAVLKSVPYDTVMGMLMRPRGMAPAGILNEITGLNLPDPTTVIGGYTGAIRYLWDDMRGKIATNVAARVFKDNDIIRTMLGNKADTLSNVLGNSYENSIKAELDRIGAASHTLHSSPDPSKVASGLEDIAPSFNRSALNQLDRDITDEALNGKITTFNSILKRSANSFARARSTQIASTYQSVMEAMHNGFRYQALATNKNRITDLDKLASQLRNLSGDAAKHGGSDEWNKLFGSVMYSNLSAQSLYQLGKMLKNDTSNALSNIFITLFGAAALHYGALATDPDALKHHSEKTPLQKLTSLTSFNGVELPLDPIMRMFTALTFPIIDHISGASDGKWNPDFLEAVDKWLEGDASKEDKEALGKDWDTSVWNAVKQNNPFDPTAIPAGAALEGSLGIDPGMTRITGEPALVQPQQISGLDPSMQKPDGLASAGMANMIGSLFSSTGQSLYTIADDMYRAYGQPGLEDSGGLDRIATERYWDNLSRSAGPAHTLFKDYENVKGISDTNYLLMKDRSQGIDDALKVYRKNIIAPTITGTDARYSSTINQEQGVLKPELHGTELGYIAEQAMALDKNFLSKYRQALSDLTEQNEHIKDEILSPIKDRNKRQNAITEQRKMINMQMLQVTRQYEDMISHQIGKPFRFDEFREKDYRQPRDSQ